MSLLTVTSASTRTYSQELARLERALAEVDAILIGAGAGLSTAAGYTYAGERFYRYFADFARAHRMTDMYTGGFFPFTSEEERWAYWSRYIWINRYAPVPSDLYAQLHALVRGRDYFVLTTNVDHCFQRAGFARKRLFYARMLYLELGMGGNTPVIIKFPFWRMAADNPRALYACVNHGEAVAPTSIATALSSLTVTPRP